MQTSSQKTESLIEILLVMIPVVFTSQLNALLEETSDQASRGSATSIFRGNIDLQSSLGVDLKFLFLVDGGTKAWIILASIFVVGVVLEIQSASLQMRDAIIGQVPLGYRYAPQGGSNQVSQQ